MSVSDRPLASARVRWGAGAGAVLAAVAVCVVALKFGGSIARAAEDPFAIDPGLTPWLLPLTKLAMEGFAVATVGCLISAAFFFPGERHSGRLLVARASLRWLWIATWTACGWAAAAAAMIAFTLADLLGVQVSDVLTVQNVGVAAEVDSTKVLLLVMALAVAVALGAQRARSVTAVGGLSLVAVGAVLPPAFAGHAAAAASHELAVSGVLMHIIGAVLWTGGLLGLLLARWQAPVAVAGAARRFSALAGLCFAVTGITGVLSGLLRIVGISSLASAYGVLLAGKLAALVVLGAFGWWHRRVSIPALVAGRPGVFGRIAWVEVTVLAATFGLAGALARTPSPGTAKLADLILSTGTLRAALDWLPDPAWTTAAVLAIGAYLAGVRRLRRDGALWPVRRTVLWVSGWLVTLAATDLKLTRSGTGMVALNDRAQHLVLLVVVPALFVASAALPLARRTLRPSPDKYLRGPLEWLDVLRWPSLRHPAMVVALYAAVAYLTYLSMTESFVLTSHAGHLGTAIAEVAIGTFVTSRIVSPEEAPVIRVALAGSALALVTLVAVTVAQSAPLPSWLSAAPPQPLPVALFTSGWLAVTCLVTLAVWVLDRLGSHASVRQAR